jgi:hypothetical protein
LIRTMPTLPEPPKRRRLSLRQKSLFLGVNALVGLGVIEGTARLLVPAPLEWLERPTRILRYDAERGWALRPNTDDFTVDKPAHVNSDGFRDREYEVEKPSGTKRIVCVGDSYTYGWGVDVEDSFPKKLESRLAKTSRTEVLNLGLFGYNTRQARLTLEKTGLKYKPDLVIYSMYWDDLLPVRADLMSEEAFNASHEKEGFTWWARHTLRRSRALFLSVNRVRALKNTFSPPKSRFHATFQALAAGDNASVRDLWEEQAREICRLRDDAASVGAKLAVVVWPLEAQVVSSLPPCKFQAEAQRICDEAGVACISLLEPLEDMFKHGQDPYLPYEQHPTPAGYERAVAHMERQLRAKKLVD